MMPLFRRSRPRGLRPEIPSAQPGTTMFHAGGQWGAIELPSPSATTVLGLPAASRARDMIANAVATMAPMELWTPDGFKSDTVPPVMARPNVTYSVFDFFQMGTQLAVMHGNFLALQADFDFTGYPQQLVPVPHGLWFAYYDEAGYLVYDVAGEKYSRDEVFHIRANAAPNQPMGVGIITQFRRALGAALDQQNMSADTYRSGAVPAGVIDLDLPEVDETQAEAVTSQWLDNHSGGRAPAVLPNTMKFTPIQWSPEDMQFLQARQYSVGEIAHMFNMDPTDLGASLAGTAASMTYANIEQRQQSRITDTYGPWMLKWEQEYGDLLPGGNTARMRPQNLLRTDSKTVAEVQQIELANETLTVDEARKSVGRRPLPKKAEPKPEPAPIEVAPNAAPPATVPTQEDAA